MIEEGLKKFKDKKFLQALNIFNELNKSNPNNGDILFFLGNIYYELNDLKEVYSILRNHLKNFQILK